MYAVTLSLPNLDADDPIDAVNAFTTQLDDAQRDGHAWTYDVVDQSGGARWRVTTAGVGADVVQTHNHPDVGKVRTAAARLERLAEDYRSAMSGVRPSERVMAIVDANALDDVARWLRDVEDQLPARVIA